MNERIKELIKQSTTIVEQGWGASYEQFDKEKFAELIVKECAGVCEWQYSHKHKDMSEGAFAAMACSDAILEHFGVEE